MDIAKKLPFYLILINSHAIHKTKEEAVQRLYNQVEPHPPQMIYKDASSSVQEGTIHHFPRYTLSAPIWMQQMILLPYQSHAPIN